MMDRAELRHEVLLAMLVGRLRNQYSQFDIATHVPYADLEGKILGELDVVVYTPVSARVYEIKGSYNGFVHGRHQMIRARENRSLWDEKDSFRAHYTIATYNNKQKWVLERCQNQS